MKLNIIVWMILILISINQGFAQTVFTVTWAGDGADSNPGDGVCDDGIGNCTLRAAIEEANSIAGKDTIEFNIPGDGPHTIQPSTPLPDITDSVVIDGYSQAGASPNTNQIDQGSNAVLMIEIDGTNPGAGETAFAILAGNSTIRGIVVNRFMGNSILLLFNGGNRIEGNFLGTDVSGTVALGNGNGIGPLSPNNIIGGTTPEARNVISGNFEGVSICCDDFAGGNLVQGNFIGTDLTGTVAIGNQVGILVLTPNNTIGGTTEAARNVISGNLFEGISIGSPDQQVISGNIVEGNFIGTDVTGTAVLGNNGIGINVSNARDNILKGNIISGNASFGVRIDGAGATGNLVQGNYIGTDVSGTVALGNGNTGVFMLQGASGNTVGGSIEAANIIAFNADDGVEVFSASTGNAILSNSIFSNNQGFPTFNGLGIDLGADGVRQANDPGDADTGPNNLQNYPEDMLFGVDENGDLMIDYRVDSDPSNSAYPLTVQFFESFPGVIPSTIGDDQGEGKFLLGEDVYALIDFAIGIKTVNFGNAGVLGITNNEFIVATATDSNGNTSEFSFPTRVGIGGILVTPTYAAPGSGIVVVTARSKSDTIGFTVFAEFQSPDNTPIETLQLFDDGEHSDGFAADGIYGVAWMVPETEERNYFVDIQVTFADTLNLEIDNAGLFTSIGPVSYDSHEIVLNTGSILVFNLNLINLGISSTALNITAEISTSDSCVTDINSDLLSFEDIVAGATLKSSGRGSIDFSQNCDGDVLLTFDLAVSSDGIAFWSDNFEMQVTIVGVNDDEIIGLPTEYSLSNAFPNPFNPTTQIEYSLPVSSKVSLIIYNLRGHEVARLIDGEQIAGVHSVIWDASSMASGMYLYRLQAGDFVHTRKMVLLK